MAAAAAATAVTAAIVTSSLAAGHDGAPPAGGFSPNPQPVRTLAGPDAQALRGELLARASLRLPAGSEPPALPDLLECRFLPQPPTGTSAKFDCVTAVGEIVRVKYNRNPEIQAEAAATRLLRMLGFPSDRVDIVPRVRCYGCPRFPFFTLKVFAFAPAMLHGEFPGDSRYNDFEWAAVERRFAAPAIETAATKGWAWYELANSRAPRADVDALRLLAIFLAHWDNKSDNQRLVCLEGGDAGLEGGGPGRVEHCARPVAMIQDLGATFGPMKVNLASWRQLPVWSNRATCEVSMRRLPFDGGTFPDARISEPARALLASELVRITDVDLHALFAGARFPEYQAATDDGRDLAAWTDAFHARVRQITDGPPCPEA